MIWGSHKTSKSTDSAEKAGRKKQQVGQAIYRRAIIDALVKLNPRWMVRNPVMFVTEVGSVLTTNGISMGATSLSLPTFYKFVLMAAMIIGKVEITIVLVSIYLGKPIVAEVVRAASSRLRVYVKGIMIG